MDPQTTQTVYQNVRMIADAINNLADAVKGLGFVFIFYVLVRIFKN